MSARLATETSDQHARGATASPRPRRHFLPAFLGIRRDSTLEPENVFFFSSLFWWRSDQKTNHEFLANLLSQLCKHPPLEIKTFSSSLLPSTLQLSEEERQTNRKVVSCHRSQNKNHNSFHTFSSGGSPALASI